MVEEFEVSLDPGHEWHSKPIRLESGSLATVSAVSDFRFYAGLFDREEYFRRRKAAAGAFDFLIGSDRTQFTSRILIRQAEDYYLVFRVSAWNRTQTIRVRWIVETSH